jgi:hypothetical protein
MNTWTVEALLDTTQSRTGLTDYGGDDFLEPLALLVDSLHTEAGLSAERLDAVFEPEGRFVGFGSPLCSGSSANC